MRCNVTNGPYACRHGRKVTSKPGLLGSTDCAGMIYTICNHAVVTKETLARREGAGVRAVFYRLKLGSRATGGVFDRGDQGWRNVFRQEARTRSAGRPGATKLLLSSLQSNQFVGLGTAEVKDTVVGAGCPSACAWRIL